MRRHANRQAGRLGLLSISLLVTGAFLLTQPDLGGTVRGTSEGGTFSVAKAWAGH